MRIKVQTAIALHIAIVGDMSRADPKRTIAEPTIDALA